MSKVKPIFLTFITLFIISCDCNQNVSGKVLDNESKQPIDSVYVHKVGRDYGEYSLKNGEFKLSYTDGGLFGCPDMNIVLTKEGYEIENVSIPNSENRIIYMKKKSN